MNDNGPASGTPSSGITPGHIAITAGIIPYHPVISVVRTVDAFYGCLAVSQVHVDGGEMEAERSLLLCGHLR